MKKFFTGAALSLIAISASAQETYESAELATEDLNGTARYVAMGGAMEALGGDISTMSTNPAGTAMFRRTWAGISGGLTIQKGNALGSGLKNGVTNADLNQVGFIFANKVGANSWFNVGFNYHKGRNLNQITAAAATLDGSSANSISQLSIGVPNYASGLAKDYTPYSALDYMDFNAVLYPSMGSDNLLVSRAANAFASHTKTSGYISNFDFNFSGNINDRVYLGLTFGIKDVRYDQSTIYGETFTQEGTYELTDRRTIRGTGFDAKFGVIIRPIEDNPFRFGVYVNTPTWYELNQQVSTDVAGKNINSYKRNDNGEITAQTNETCTSYHDTYGSPTYYKITTPWKFGLSLGSTFGNNIALGLTYQFSDYSSINNRINTGEYYDARTYYDGWGRYSTYETSSKTYADDNDMNRNTKNSLKGVHLVKVGMEVKPIRTVAIRVGYNYESAIYEKNGTKDYTMTTRSTGNVNTLRSFTNWQATHRITCGVGLQLYKNLSLDLSYQYAAQKGDFYPFQKATSTDGNLTTNPTVCEVKNNRHLINATLGVRF